MNPIHEALSFVAKMIDGELFTYDDGYVIEIKNPTLWLKANADGSKPWGNNQNATDLESVSGVKILYDEDGTFNTIQYC